VEKAIAVFGLLVAITMALMKAIPAIPGHFTLYEWIALAIWIVIGAIAATSKTRKSVPETVPQR